ncbi:hypothetical protein HKBW3S42_01071 [Candidatus Hakubella thermalkaliphila]|uniref:Uncharacterized protein n=2 Tax=Candidatus Hakubella thermalkaliphila TaxID=2754717 RepID=A0A6V8NWN0_9ACTN|nr:hypothetical protein [Candidatus Hakubella thermalkaliphila]GFP21314.1 hypothetical protein HKBW3S06_00540 [Candidatus Hakubella thermalkaliphila]GFP24587.1 hypothetical protein HKBW3S25_00025 [Candidatus Hakubella thermalkaliphila]GFP32765.1 hypothetical protein HKBW3S42_01071 [Candidatus Hakubella thermalkaliphila]GFP35789.1 hypothetical protein HKBW3S43_01577 [Candidatus Hakubella thermalkaliphila]
MLTKLQLQAFSDRFRISLQTYEAFEEQVKEMQKRWVGDLERLLTSVPPYEEIRDVVLEKFKLLK